MKTDEKTGKLLKIAVFGSGKGSNLQAILDAIDAGTLNAAVVCVLSDVENAYILERARKHDIPAFFVSAEPFKTKLEGLAEDKYIGLARKHGAEAIALAGFMRMLKTKLLTAYRGKLINIHPSILPSFPGLESWKQALDYGVKVTGCTVHFVDEGMDTGQIILQRTVPVLENDTPESLHARIQVEEHIAYPEALRLIAEGKVSARRTGP